MVSRYPLYETRRGFDYAKGKKSAAGYLRARPSWPCGPRSWAREKPAWPRRPCSDLAQLRRYPSGGDSPSLATNNVSPGFFVAARLNGGAAPMENFYSAQHNLA